MAMHLRTVKNPAPGPDPATAQSAQAGKHDAYVATQLRRAEHRIRMLDVSAALLGFLALTCACVGGVALADYLLPSFAFVRPFVLVGYLLVAAAYLAITLARPLVRRINPYYTAARMEHTTPGAKNSVINWLDLHDAKLPPVIRNSLGQRAAKDLARADVEKAFSGKRTAWLGVVAGAFVGVLIAQLFWIGPGEFFFHVRRSFAPSAVPPTRTTLTVVQPVGGNATVTAGKPVRVAVEVGGKVPDPGSATALMLHYRYDESDPYTTHNLQQDSTGEWSYSFFAADVRDGFLYKISGGDAETPEYQIKVQTSPLIHDVEATYHYRDYTGRIDDIRVGRPSRIEALRGTEVTLLVHTNRKLKDAHIEFENPDGAERIPAKISEKDARTFLVQFVVDHTTKYRLHFTSTDNEANEDNKPHPIVAIPDTPPNPVELTVPGKDSELPVNGVLQLEGKALDDIGVKNLTLQMQVVNGPDLLGQKYRSDKELALPGGGYPRELSYKDVIDLAKVKTAIGGAIQLQPGMELEYWLEARDACDYPQPDVNVTQSKHFRIKLLPPETDEKKQKDEREQANKEKQQHDKKQSDDLKKEAERRDEEKRKEEAKQKEEQKRREEEKKQGDQKPDKPEPKEGDKGDKGDKPNESNPGQSEKDKDLEKKLNDIKHKDEERKNHGEQKDDPKKEPGEAKGDGQKDQPQPGESKQEPKPSDKKEAGDAKGAGAQKPGEQQEQRSSDKPEAGSNPMEAKAEAKKDSAQQPNEAHADAKGQNQPQPQQKPESSSEAKPGGSQEQQKQAAESKPDAKPQPGAKSEAKPESTNGANEKQAPAEAKEKPEAADKSEAKPEGGNKAEQQAKATPKEGAQGEKGDKAPEGANKNDPMTPQNRDVPRGDGKGDEKKDAANPKEATTEAEAKKAEQEKKAQEAARQATKEDVERLKKDLNGNDPEKFKKAVENLERVERNADDPKAREGAEQALKEWMEKHPDQVEKTPPPSEGKGLKKQPGETPADNKDKKDPTKDDTGEAKGGGDPQESKSDQKQKPTDVMSLPKGLGNNERVTRNSRSEEPPPLNQKPEDHNAGTLQLEDIRKKLDKDMLKELNWTEEDKERFLKDYADALKRDQAKKEKLAGPQNTSSLPSIGAQQVKPGDKTDTSSRDKPLPPPEYRNPFAKFLEDVNKTEKKDK
jgi:hypothetical protein